MWPPSIGPSEILILIVVTVLVLLLSARYSRWLLGIIACFAAAVVVTPSDPRSTLIAGGALSLFYAVAVVIGLWLLRDGEA